jgi:hypothetical protein
MWPVDMPQLTIPIAATRSPAAADAVQDPVTRALVGVLNNRDECNRESVRRGPFARPA